MSQQHVVAAESRGLVDHHQPRQLSRGGIVRVWAAAAGPMAVLSWLVAPLLATRLTGPAAWPQALLLCLTAGLVWQGVLVLVLVRRELGSLRWSAVQDALWLHRPRSPRTGRVGGRVWWVLLPAILVVGVEQLLPSLPTPAGRDMGSVSAGLRGPGLPLRELALVRPDRRHGRLQHRAR